ncbi:MAG: ABC transporter ATP-binding protein [Dehalococcoidales bacterium]|jgi:ABC-type multidrug transport system fused ATPase/permease subunit
MIKLPNILNLIWYFFKPYKLDIIVLLILSVLVGFFEAGTLVAVYPILTAAFDTGAGQDNVIFSLLAMLVNLLPIADEFVSYCALFMLLALLAFVTKLISINFRARFAARLVKKNQNDVFNKFLRADYQYFIEHKQGELIYNAVSAPQGLSTLIISVTETVLQAILSISILALLFSLSWQGTVTVMLIGLGYHYFISFLGRKVSYMASRKEMDAQRGSNVILNEAINGIKQIKVYNTEANWIDRFTSVIKNRWYYFIKRNIWQQVPPPILMFILYISIGIIALLLKILVPVDYTTLIPVFGTFALAIYRLVPVVGTIGTLAMSIMGAIPTCEAVYSILNTRITHIVDGEKELSSFKSSMEIKFDNVSFAYKGRTKTLENISITFEKGKTTAIVGRSGSGKTTLINLLLRLFEPTSGEIRINGLNIKKYKLSSWLNRIGYVSQDTFIFNDTIEKNITFHSDSYSHEQVIKAAKYADAHDFIITLPDDYNTITGDKGIGLSGGQAQRIAVARAMIREPEILIFDEATNNLDNISEAAVQRAIDEISKDHTVIIIAHRLSTIANADKIIVLENERVVEEGTHKQLLANRGAYWELCQREPI